MEYNRMSTKDMLQYCDEALAWEEFGPVDVFFFESVKRILLGQCSAVEMQEPDELANVAMPIDAEELMNYDEGDAELTECIHEETFFDRRTTYTLAGQQEGRDGQ